MRFLLLLTIFVHSMSSQYASEPYLPPAHVPQQTDVPPTKLRAPPIPTWVERLKEEESVNGVAGDGDLLTNEDETSGNNSGTIEAQDASGTDTGSGSGIEASPPSGEASTDDFNEMMSKMDQEAEASGINCASDLIFVVDATSSVRGVFELYIKFIQKVIEGLDISESVDHVGVIVYSSEKKQKEKIHLGQYNKPADLQKAIEALPFFSGITATGEALKFAAEHTKNRRDNLTLNYVVLTDGYSYDLIESGARKLKTVPNANVFAVSIGDAFLKTELEIITGDPDNVFQGESAYGTLVKRIKNCDARKGFQNDVKTDSVKARFIPTPVDSQGRHLIPNAFHTKTGIVSFNDKATDEQIAQAVKESARLHRVIAPTTETPYLTTTCEFDIGIVLDASGSLTQSFQKQLQMANKLIEQLPIAENKTRVAIIQFAGKTRTKVLVSFNDKIVKSQIKKIVTLSNFYSGTTFTNQALLRMADLYQISDRKKVLKQMIIFTDGYSAENTDIGIERLKAMGVKIFTVGVSQDGQKLNVNELEAMASSRLNFFESNEFDSLLPQFPSTKYC